MPTDHARRVVLDGNTVHRLGRNSWRKLSQEIMDTMPVELSSRETEDLYINPPWSTSLGNWKVELVPPDSPNEADHTSTFDHNHPVIYTDGSARDGFRDGGAGFVVIKGDLGVDEVIHSASMRGRAFTSPFEEEREAMGMALD